jgi:hypothetical protein
MYGSMNLPAASHGVSMNDKFYPNAASCGELNPADFAIGHRKFTVICVICGLKQIQKRCDMNPGVS